MSADVLVLGAGGTFGHVVVSLLSRKYKLIATTRQPGKDIVALNADLVGFDVIAGDDQLVALLRRLKPDGLVINAIAVPSPEIATGLASSREQAIAINAVFPNRLARIASDLAIRVLHVSTDAVFPRLSGRVDEADTIGPEDFYGVTKAAGELEDAHCVTLRCSVIGPPAQGRQRGLWAWVLSQPKGASIRGYTNQLWAGLTTQQLAMLCMKLVEQEHFSNVRRHAAIHHAVPNPVVSKFAIVQSLCMSLRPDLTIEPAKAEHAVTRVLTTRFAALDRYVPHFENWAEAINSARN